MAKKILIIDDEPALQEMIKMRLEASNYEVITASNGLEGLDKARSEKPDLIILDILMPKVSGYEFLRQLRKEEGELKKTPVIVVSARGRMKELFEEIGIDGFLGKPFDSAELLDKVKLTLTKGREEPGKPKCALIIGRDKAAVELLKAFLETHDFIVILVQSAALGIEKAVKEKPDLILSQSILEDMDGSELCRILRGMTGMQDVPFIIFSSRDAAFVVEELFSGEKLVEYSQPQELIKKIGEYLKEDKDIDE